MNENRYFDSFDNKKFTDDCHIELCSCYPYCVCVSSMRQSIDALLSPFHFRLFILIDDRCELCVVCCYCLNTRSTKHEQVYRQIYIRATYKLRRKCFVLSLAAVDDITIIHNRNSTEIYMAFRSDSDGQIMNTIGMRNHQLTYISILPIFTRFA